MKRTMLTNRQSAGTRSVVGVGTIISRKPGAAKNLRGGQNHAHGRFHAVRKEGCEEI